MTDQPLMVGRVLRASTTSFAIGCTQLISEQEQFGPEFGALVKAPRASDRNGGPGATYGLIYNVSFGDDPFARQLVAAGVENEEIIQDLAQNRQVPIVVEVLVLGYGQGEQIYHRLPPQPPNALSRIYGCNNAEVVRFTARSEWMRTVLVSAEAPADQLLVAALRQATAARPPDQRESYLLGAGRELARLLALEMPRLEGVLGLLR